MFLLVCITTVTYNSNLPLHEWCWIVALFLVEVFSLRFLWLRPLFAPQVRKHMAECTCGNRIKLQRLDEGRYQLGSRIYFLRRFRSHIMVRVGGGWLTLSQFLERYDPCRQKQGQLICKTALQDGISVQAADLLESWPSEGQNEICFPSKFHKGPCC